MNSVRSSSSILPNLSSFDAKEYLDSFINYEHQLHKVSSGNFKLERFHQLLDRMGNPQKHLKILHVAGTKGKGSTCIFAANILKAAGKKVGLYTSPHMINVNERIRVLNPRQDVLSDEDFPGAISDEDLNDNLFKLKPILEEFRKQDELSSLSYFEVLTALAFYYFHKERADYVVLETGLGGRLDATNVAPSLICGITPISLEHTKILGESLKKIAAEKAAIIKEKDQKVVVAPQENDVFSVVDQRCRKFNIKPIYVGKDIKYSRKTERVEEQVFDVIGGKGEYRALKTHLLGEQQAMNAAMAIAMVEALEDKDLNMSQEAVSSGVRETCWPGRFEILRRDPFLILDCAHNEASFLSFLKTYEEVFPKKKAILILGISEDKNISVISCLIGENISIIIATKADHPRAHQFDEGELEQLFPGKSCFITDNVEDALTIAQRQSDKEDVVLVAGSVFLVSEVRQLCIK